jgi:hypothetical protein
LHFKSKPNLNYLKKHNKKNFFYIFKDKHGNKLEYIIPHKGNSLRKIFGVMESNKCGYSIADYSVSQTTLDQVKIKEKLYYLNYEKRFYLNDFSK